MLLTQEYASIAEDFAIDAEPIRLFTYRAQSEDTLNPPGFVSIFNYELNEEEMNLYSLVFTKSIRAYGLYSLSNEGAEYIGLGSTPEEALAHGVYQTVRCDFWHNGLPFLPDIEHTDAWIVDEAECIPTRHSVHVDEETLTESEGIETVWVTEYAPSQFAWSLTFVAAVECLLPHLPTSWKVH